ncbi:MAG TPA: hypothetical protein VFT58_02780, partial [Nitrososphaera sp.]|nr:hypothetical protein [Nitrososphaera sp.]
MKSNSAHAPAPMPQGNDARMRALSSLRSKVRTNVHCSLLKGARMTTAPRHDHVGLYNPEFEHDACGIGFVARLSGEASHEIVELAVTAVGRMAHRGGVAADGKTGDGAGILTQIPRAFFARELEQRGIAYPIDDLVVAMCFLPQEAAQLALSRDL